MDLPCFLNVTSAVIHKVDLKTSSTRIGRGKRFSPRYSKNRQPFCDLIRPLLCFTSLCRPKIPCMFASRYWICALKRRFQQTFTLFQRWYLLGSESWADVHLSTLSQRMFIGVASTLRKKYWNNFVNICFTDVHCKEAQ